jgi:hypothetical protein
VLSHRSAAGLWGLRTDREAAVEVTTPRKVRSSGSIWRHRAILEPEEVSVRRGIPVTALTRTLLDAAATSSRERIESIVREADYRYRLRPDDLEGYLQQRRGRRGAARLRACLDILRAPRGRTRSRLEDRFAGIVARSALPRPALNTLLELDGEMVEVDCLWRRQRLIVELDGMQSHGTHSVSESDKKRDRRLQAEGWRVVRLTWRHLDEPESVLADLRRLLGVESALTRA